MSSSDGHHFVTLAAPADGDATTTLQERAAVDRLAFWAEQANKLHWHSGWSDVLDWSHPPFARWLSGGNLHIAYNCVDRHVQQGHGDQVSFFWEGEPGDTRTITCSRLQEEVRKPSNAHMLAGYDLSSIRMLGSVGEPIAPETYRCYQRHTGDAGHPSRTPGGRQRPAPS